jgi:chaperonin GroES
MNVRPFRDCLLVHRLEDAPPADHVIDAAAAVASEEETQQGEVLAVGRGKPPSDATKVPLAIKVGDKILFGRHPRTEIHIDGQAVLVVREDQVLAVLA